MQVNITCKCGVNSNICLSSCVCASTLYSGTLGLKQRTENTTQLIRFCEKIIASRNQTVLKEQVQSKLCITSSHTSMASRNALIK